jgi:hypothetical protein
MWRPFIRRFSGRTYENFLEKQSKLENSVTPGNPSSSTSLVLPFTRSLSVDNTLRYEEYKSLQSRVKNQRNLIQKQEKTHSRKVKTACIEFKHEQEYEKLQKHENMERFRKFSNNKTRKMHILNLNTKPANEFLEKTFFNLTPKPRELAKIVIRSSRRAKLKQSRNLRDFQDKKMKELKVTAPSYYKELKQEFMKIRQHCEMTFENYTKSKRLKRTNPYDIIKKGKNL